MLTRTVRTTVPIMQNEIENITKQYFNICNIWSKSVIRKTAMTVTHIEIQMFLITCPEYDKICQSVTEIWTTDVCICWSLLLLSPRPAVAPMAPSVRRSGWDNSVLIKGPMNDADLKLIILGLQSHLQDHLRWCLKTRREVLKVAIAITWEKQA